MSSTRYGITQESSLPSFTFSQTHNLILQDIPTGQEPVSAPVAEEEARLQAELETYRDIREYLRKWNETNPNILDPVRELGSIKSPGDPGQLVGNMLNGREASE